MLLRILEESIYRLATDPQCGPDKMNLRAIQVLGYSMGSTGAFNLACTHGRLLAGCIGFASPPDKHLYCKESSVANLRDLWVVGFEMQHDKPEHCTGDFFKHCQSTGYAKNSNKEYIANHTFKHRHSNGKRGMRPYKVASYGNESRKFHVQIDPLLEKGDCTLGELSTMDRHDCWKPILSHTATEFRFGDDGEPGMYFIPWMYGRIRRRGPVALLPEIVFDVTLRRGPAPCLAMPYGCQDPGCVANRFGVIARLDETDKTKPKVGVAVNMEWQAGTPLESVAIDVMQPRAQIWPINRPLETDSAAENPSFVCCRVGSETCVGDITKPIIGGHLFSDGSIVRYDMGGEYPQGSNPSTASNSLICKECYSELLRPAKVPRVGDQILSVKTDKSENAITDKQEIVRMVMGTPAAVCGVCTETYSGDKLLDPPMTDVPRKITIKIERKAALVSALPLVRLTTPYMDTQYEKVKDVEFQQEQLREAQSRSKSRGRSTTKTPQPRKGSPSPDFSSIKDKCIEIPPAVPCPHGKDDKRSCPHKDCSGCPHGQFKRLCTHIDCSGCPCGVLKKYCRNCSLCEHGIMAHQCMNMKCNGCPHGYIKKFCRTCKPCPHGNAEASCAQWGCGLCIHGVLLDKCNKPECSGCIHGKDRGECRELTCGGCIHGRIKAKCKEVTCGGCKHGRLLKFCKEPGCSGCPGHDDKYKSLPYDRKVLRNKCKICTPNQKQGNESKAHNPRVRSANRRSRSAWTENSNWYSSEAPSSSPNPSVSTGPKPTPESSRSLPDSSIEKDASSVNQSATKSVPNSAASPDVEMSEGPVADDRCRLPTPARELSVIDECTAMSDADGHAILSPEQEYLKHFNSDFGGCNSLWFVRQDVSMRAVYRKWCIGDYDWYVDLSFRRHFPYLYRPSEGLKYIRLLYADEKKTKVESKEEVIPKWDETILDDETTVYFPEDPHGTFNSTFTQWVSDIRNGRTLCPVARKAIFDKVRHQLEVCSAFTPRQEQEWSRLLKNVHGNIHHIPTALQVKEAFSVFNSAKPKEVKKWQNTVVRQIGKINKGSTKPVNGNLLNFR